MREGVSAAVEQAETLRRLEEYRAGYGAYPAEDKEVARFLRRRPAVKGVYEVLVEPDAAIFTEENVYRQAVEVVDGHNPAVRALLSLRERLIPGSEAAVRAAFPEAADALVLEMRRNPDIFWTPDDAGGRWELREDFVAGDVWEKYDALKAAAAGERDAATRAKLEYGAAELEKAAGWTPIEEADFSPRSAWVSERVVNAWVKDSEGLGRSGLLEDGRLARNESDKWGVVYDADHTFYDRKTYENVVVKAGEWTELADPVAYYLNMQKQRSSYNDTETFDREHDESFKNYIANHPTFRDELERTYNRIFNAEIAAPVKTYPVRLEGWNDDDRAKEAGGTGGKKLRAHQWQSLHHLYRQGKGISALGTGFGKTLTGVALIALLRQEGKLNRVWLQVPNNKVKDWVAEIAAVMPGLKVASMDAEDAQYANRGKRYRKYQEMANSKADVILMPESAAGEIQLTPENDERISDAVAAKYKIERKEAGGSKRRQEKAEERGLFAARSGKANKTAYFEDFACDAIVVDEGHRYKNLFTSSLSRETGMNDGRRSDKAMSLFKKTEYVRGECGGKNVFALTATPLTNSPLEYFNMISFIAPERLEKFGIHTIDGFIKNFADIQQLDGYDWKTGGVANKRTLVGFKNLQTLQALFFKYTDYQNDPAKVEIKKPEAVNFPNVIPRDERQTGVLREISEDLERYQAATAEERRDQFPGQNFLTFYSRMRTASLDLELYDPTGYKGWKNPKLEKLAENAFASWRD